MTNGTTPGDGTPGGKPHLFELLAAARKFRCGNPGVKATLVMLLEHMGEHDGVWSCWPSNKVLAFYVERDPSTVRAHLDQLRKMGVLNTETRHHPEGGQTTNCHVLCVDVLLTGTPLPDTGTPPADVATPPSETGTPPASLTGSHELLDELPDEQHSPTNGHTYPTSEEVRLRKVPYPDDFEAVWTAYPSRGNRGNPKQGAYAKWLARIREARLARVPVERRVEAMLTATRNYARSVEENGTAPEYVMQAERFFGPANPWRDYVKWESGNDTGRAWEA